MKNIKYTLIFQLLLIVIIFINYKKNIFNVDIEKAIFVGIFNLLQINEINDFT